MSTVQQLLNVLKKTFYDLTPVSNKQMSLMSMANGGIGFCKYEAKLLSFALLGSIMADQNRVFVTSQISTRLRRSRQQSSLFYYPCASLLRTIFESLARAYQRVCVQNVRDFPQTKLDSEINAPFLLNEHGDPHFLFHNFKESNILSN